ncbi:MAG TPA: prealbumin-like fold domain-containing protein [Chthoniobacterales bacterium]|jgi:hypothetical protein
MKKLIPLSLFFTTMVSCVLMAQEASPSPGASSGIEGIISISPAHGGPTIQGSSNAKPLANVTFEVRQSDRIVGSFQTDGQGHFRILLPPGHYSVTRKGIAGAVGSYGPFQVKVSAGKMAGVQWECDSGLR